MKNCLFSKKKFALLLLCVVFLSNFLCQESLSFSYKKGSGHHFGHHDIWLAAIGFRGDTPKFSQMKTFGECGPVNHKLCEALTYGNQVLQMAIDHIVPSKKDIFSDDVYCIDPSKSKNIFSDDVERLKRETGVGDDVLNEFSHRKVFHWGFTKQGYQLEKILDRRFSGNKETHRNGIHQKSRREKFTKGLIDIWSYRKEKSIEAFQEGGFFDRDEAEQLAIFFYDLHILADYLTKDREYLIPLQPLAIEMKKSLSKLYGENNEICSKYLDERELRSFPALYSGENCDLVAAEILNTVFEHHPSMFWDYINRKLCPNELNFCVPQKIFSLGHVDDGNEGRIWYLQ